MKYHQLFASSAPAHQAVEVEPPLEVVVVAFPVAEEVAAPKACLAVGARA